MTRDDLIEKLILEGEQLVEDMVLPGDIWRSRLWRWKCTFYEIFVLPFMP